MIDGAQECYSRLRRVFKSMFTGIFSKFIGQPSQKKLCVHSRTRLVMSLKIWDMSQPHLPPPCSFFSLRATPEEC